MADRLGARGPRDPAVSGALFSVSGFAAGERACKNIAELSVKYIYVKPTSVWWLCSEHIYTTRATRPDLPGSTSRYSQQNLCLGASAAVQFWVRPRFARSLVGLNQHLILKGWNPPTYRQLPRNFDQKDLSL